MRTRILLLPVALFALGLFAGCGERNLVVNVDVLSYLDPAATQFAFGPVPAVPGGFSTGEAVIVKDAQVNLIARPNDVAKVQDVWLTITAEVVDSTGAGSDTLRLYMSDSDTDPLTTPAVATLPVQLTAGQTDTVSVEVRADQRLTSVFDGKDMRLTMTNSLRGPSSGATLNGRLRFTDIRATVIANRKGL